VFSVEQLLSQREMDPETVLSNLGFGRGPVVDEDMLRIPDRFLQQSRVKQGTNFQQYLLSHADTHPSYLPAMSPSSLPVTPGSPLVHSSPVHFTHSGSREPVKEEVVEIAAPKGKGQLQNLDSYFSNSLPSLQSDSDIYNTEFKTEVSDVNKENEDVKLLHSSRLLELSGIVPERYLIKSPKAKLKFGSNSESQDYLENVLKDQENNCVTVPDKKYHNVTTVAAEIHKHGN